MNDTQQDTSKAIGVMFMEMCLCLVGMHLRVNSSVWKEFASNNQLKWGLSCYIYGWSKILYSI